MTKLYTIATPEVSINAQGGGWDEFTIGMTMYHVFEKLPPLFSTREKAEKWAYDNLGFRKTSKRGVRWMIAELEMIE